MLINREMWVPKPEAFNDPFDCSLVPGRTKTTVDLQHQLIQIIGELYDPEEAEVQAREIKKRNESKPVTEIEDKSLSRHLEEAKDLGIFSLSEKNDSILMWSHYADDHKGFCIEFERRDQKENFLSHFMCRRVQYSTRYPDLNRVLESLDVNFYSKAKDWNYEAEWRLVTKTGNIALPLPAPISSIIFGMRASDRNMATVQNFLKKENVSYYQAVRKPGEYALEIRKI